MNDKLYDEMIADCDRLQEIIDNSEVGSDEWKVAYNKKMELYDKMNAYNKADSDYLSRQEDRKVQEEHNREMREIEREKLKQHEEIEKIRNEAAKDLEKEKQKVTWQRATLRIAEVGIPIILSYIAVHNEGTRMFKFEEHGRLVSSQARAYLSRLTKFWK